MRCAGPYSIADRLARNTGVAQQAQACSRLTMELEPPVVCVIGEVL
jgi:hypothetical protein